jgi:hypothetical protein
MEQRLYMNFLREEHLKEQFAFDPGRLCIKENTLPSLSPDPIHYITSPNRACSSRSRRASCASPACGSPLASAPRFPDKARFHFLQIRKPVLQSANNPILLRGCRAS